MIYKTGNLLSATHGVIAHQTNCQGVMGSGVALQIKKTYPTAFNEYRKFCDVTEPKDLLGTTQIVRVGQRLYIGNIFGQLDYGTDKIQVDYSALHSGVKSLFEFTNLTIVPEAHFPDMIGCGLAGGDRDKVISIIESCAEETQFDKKNITFWKFVV